MEEVVHVTEEKERVANYKAVYVTEITDTMHFYTQDVETGTLRVCVRMRTCAEPLRTEVL